MTSFIFIAALITIVSIAVMVWPLLKPSESRSFQRQEQNIHYAKQRLTELENQLANGSISNDDYNDLKLEIEATLALDLNVQDPDDTAASPSKQAPNGILIALICCLIPFAGLVLYQVTGTPAAISPQPPVQASAAGQNGQPTQQDIGVMVLKLEQRLQQQPDDVEGWTMLARTYLALGRYQHAIDANQQLLKLRGEQPDIYAALAEASALLVNGAVAGVPLQYVQKALALNADHPQALWLAGLAAAQQGDKTQARSYWEKLLPQLDNAPEQQQELRNIIQQTYDQSPVASESAPAVSPGSPYVSPTDAAVTGLRVRISLADSIASQVSPNDSVFVFVKAQNGPPAPLAVKRLTVADLPTMLSLSDADAMMPQFKLSLFEDVTVSARVSKSGGPIAQSGDIQSAIFESKNNNPALIELPISEILP